MTFDHIFPFLNNKTHQSTYEKKKISTADHYYRKASAKILSASHFRAINLVQKQI